MGRMDTKKKNNKINDIRVVDDERIVSSSSCGSGSSSSG